MGNNESNKSNKIIHGSGHSILDDLIEKGGNWKLVFQYCNWDNDNVLILLPNFCNDDNEQKKNDAVMELTDGIFEEMLILNEYLDCNLNTPFIVKGYCLDKCIEIMKERMDLYTDQNGNIDYNKFGVELKKYDDFRLAVFNIQNQGEAAIYDASYNSYKKYI